MGTPKDTAMDPAMLDCLARARQQLDHRLAERAPALASRVGDWFSSLAPEGTSPEGYFLHPFAFPLIALPWWMDQQIDGRVEIEAQLALMRSSLAGYLLIRLVDDVMDGAPAACPRLLPATGVLALELRAGLEELLHPGDPFWPRFERLWALGLEAAVLDAEREEIDEPTFQALSGRKVMAAEIPLLAVARRHGLPELPAAWKALFDRLAPWHQRHNDLVDWRRDLERGTSTALLSAARREARPGEPPALWIASEGFEREIRRLREELGGLRRAAGELGSEGLRGWLDQRAALLDELEAQARPGLALVRLLAST